MDKSRILYLVFRLPFLWRRNSESQSLNIASNRIDFKVRLSRRTSNYTIILDRSKVAEAGKLKLADFTTSHDNQLPPCPSDRHIESSTILECFFCGHVPTVLKMITSLSLPWKASTVLTSSLPSMSNTLTMLTLFAMRQSLITSACKRAKM